MGAGKPRFGHSASLNQRPPAGRAASKTRRRAADRREGKVHSIGSSCQSKCVERLSRASSGDGPLAKRAPQRAPSPVVPPSALDTLDLRHFASRRAEILLGSDQISMNPFDSDWSNVSPVS